MFVYILTSPIVFLHYQYIVKQIDGKVWFLLKTVRVLL